MLRQLQKQLLLPVGIGDVGQTLENRRMVGNEHIRLEGHRLGHSLSRHIQSQHDFVHCLAATAQHQSHIIPILRQLGRGYFF